MNNIGVYIRVANKDDYEVENQKKLAQIYIDSKEYSYGKIYYYIDNGVSGSCIDRLGLNNLIDDYNNKKINLIVTKDISRITRNIVDIYYLEEKGIQPEKIDFIVHEKYYNKAFDLSYLIRNKISENKSKVKYEKDFLNER